MEIDPDFNVGVRETLLDFFPGMLRGLKDMFDPETDENSRALIYARKLGLNTCENLYDRLVEDFNKRECLSHNDLHVFNILVEKKPNVNTLEQFGPQGNYVLCDWEMTISSNPGRDVGYFYCFPVACIVAHAINGNKHLSESILNILNLFWTEYSSALLESGQNTAEGLLKIYRSAIGQCGWFNFHPQFLLGIHVDLLPFEGNMSSAAKAKESLGYLGLKLLELGYGNAYEDESLESLQSMFQMIMEEEINNLLPSRPSRLNIRSSMLRATGRRVSDASMFSSVISKGHLDVV